MNASYDILTAIRNRPPVIEEAKPRTRKATTREDATANQLLKKLSPAELLKLLGG